MAEEQSSSSNKTPLYCGIASILMIILLLVCTELIFDCSVLLNRITLIFLLVAIVPFCVMKMSNAKVANLISIVSAVFVLLTCMLLFYRRNKVTRVFVTQSDKEITIELTKMLKPSGVLLIAGTKDIVFPEDEVVDALATPEVVEAIAKRSKTAEKVDPTTGKTLFNGQDLSKTRLSGIKNQLVLYVEQVSEKDATEMGFTILKPKEKE